MVKVVRGIMGKAEELGSDPHLAMLICRATPWCKVDQLWKAVSRGWQISTLHSSLLYTMQAAMSPSE